jgi:hypothetical protein
MSIASESARCRLLAGSLLAAVLLAALLLATSPQLPLAWDEGNAILRAEQLPHQWPYTTSHEGHPALYGIVIALGQWAAGAWLGPVEAARLGPIALMALAAGAMCYRLARDYGLVVALGAVTALLLLPRLFAHAHFASCDGPLTSCWVLAWATFPRPRRGDCAADPAVHWAAIAAWGIALGMTLSCKATGWIAPLPFLVWTVVYRDRTAAKALCFGLPVALATFFLLNPPLWHDPLQGWATFFRLNLSRASQPGLNISTQFFGRMYNLDYSLPWYNTLVWTAITVPLGMLLLAAVGVVAVAARRRQQPAGVLLLANWLVLPVVRALPGTPPHDAERLFLPSFAFLAALAGLGCAEMIRWAAKRRWREGVGSPFPPTICHVEDAMTERDSRPLGMLRARPWPPWRTLLLIFVLYAGSASSLWWYAPQWLSYYSLLIGGLPGATASGMEPTYYWDALDRSVLQWLHEHTSADEKICFAAAPSENLLLLRRWHVLRRFTGSEDPGTFRWYVLQRRPSGLRPEDLWLIEHVRPAHCKTIRPGGLGPWRLDVPLVEVYLYEDHLRACAEVRPPGRR